MYVNRSGGFCLAEVRNLENHRWGRAPSIYKRCSLKPSGHDSLQKAEKSSIVRLETPGMSSKPRHQTPCMMSMMLRLSSAPKPQRPHPSGCTWIIRHVSVKHAFLMRTEQSLTSFHPTPPITVYNCRVPRELRGSRNMQELLVDSTQAKESASFTKSSQQTETNCRQLVPSSRAVPLLSVFLIHTS